MKTQLWLLSFLVVAFLALYAGFEHLRDEGVPEEPPRLLVAVPSQAIERISFRNYERGGGEVSVVREGAQWRMESPFEGRAENARIESLVRVLTDFPFLQPFESEDDEEALGLGSRLQGRIEVEGAFGTTRLEIGIRLSALSDERVVRRSGPPEPEGVTNLYRFPQTLWNAINDSPFNFLRKSLSDLSGEEVREIRMERAGAEPIVLTRADDGAFSIASPYRARMDVRTSRRLAARVASLQREQVLYGAYRTETGALELDYDPVQLGLEPPSFELTIGDGRRRATTIHIGLPESVLSEEPEANQGVPRWFARLPGDTEVFVVREDPLAELLGDGTELRPRGIGRTFESPLEDLTWRGGPHGVQGPLVSLRSGPVVRIDREEARLLMKEPVEHAVDLEALASWFDGFAGLSATRFLLRSSVSSFEEAATLELRMRDGETVRFAAADADENGKHLVSFGDPDLLAVLDASTIALLWPDPAWLLTRRLLPCDVSNVTRLAFVRAGEESPAFEARASTPLAFVDGEGNPLSPRERERVATWVALTAERREIGVTATGELVWTMILETREGQTYRVLFHDAGEVMQVVVGDDPIGILRAGSLKFPS